ncbi:MAG: hypothetical protein JRD87_02600 [Deltaproteobacteria bacterium]|nr:hypothetical protein [Deltaproteobacteria bacterium]MBW2668775.1 hypothetical protein [Deltaproteobacteria bacterium]
MFSHRIATFNEAPRRNGISTVLRQAGGVLKIIMATSVDSIELARFL